jgi:uncharacterized protein YhdP
MKLAARKKLVIALGILVLSAFIATLLIPKLLDPDRYHDLIVSEIEKVLGGKVRIGDISWGVLRGLWLEVEGFEITAASAIPMDFKLSRLYASVSLLPLIKKKIVLNHLHLESPEVQLRLQHAPQQPPSTKDPSSGATHGGIALPIEIEDLLVAKGRIRVEDRLSLPGKAMAHVFGDLEMRASNLAPGREMLFDISMKDKAELGFGTFKAQGSFAGLTDSLKLQNPKLAVHASLSDFHTEALRPYLGDAAWVQRLSGSLSAEVNYEGDLGSRHRAEGNMDLTQTAFSYPSLWEAVLPGAETKIAYRADLQGDDLSVDKLEVKVGEFSFRARGGVFGLQKRPMIKNASFSAVVPLKDSVPLFPWKVLGDSAPFVRAIFEGGGKVEIDQAVLPTIDLAEPPANAVALLNAIESTSRILGVSVALAPDIPRIKNIDIDVHLAQGTAQVQVQRSQFTTAELPSISGKVAKLFQAPLIDVAVKGPVQMSGQHPEDLAAFFRRCGLEELVGSVHIDTAVVVDTSRLEDFQVRGNVGLRDARAKAPVSPARLEGLRADLVLTPRAADIAGLSASVVVPAGASAPEGRFDLGLEARIDEWSRRPSVTLLRLKTSSVPLPVVASLVPWEKLGESAEPFKQTFLNGGRVTIENITLPRIELFNLPKSPAQVLPKTRAAAGFAGVVVHHYSRLPGFEDIRGRITLENGVLTGSGVKGRIGPLTLPDLELRASRLEDQPKVAVRAKGPVELVPTSDQKVEDLLKRYGLKSLVVSADVDVRADFDATLKEGWVADASLTLGKVRAETYPEGVVLDNLQGRLTVKQKNGTHITAEKFSGRVNQAPVQLSGKILGVGTPNLLIDVKAGAKKLDLAHVRELSPSLKTLGLAGTVDMDLNIYLPYASASNTRLSGTLSTGNLSFRTAHMTVEEGDTELYLTGNTALIKRAQVRVNESLLAVTGKIADPVEPDIQLYVTSHDLNLDRLMPFGGEEVSGEKPLQEQHGRVPEKTPKMPPVALRTTADIQVEVDKARYKGTTFEKLILDVSYDRGVIQQGDLSFDLDGGQLSLTGSGDLRDLEHVSFTVSPNIKALPLERLAALLGVHEVSVTGPVSAKGRLQGRAGSSNDVLAGLQGNVDAQIGPGTLARIGRGGEILARLFSLTSLRGILTGSVFDRFATDGFPFRSISAQAAFSNGHMEFNDFRFESNAMNMDARGRVNLLEAQLDITARLKPLGAVSTVAGAVPVVGKVAASLTEIHFNVSGSVDDPRVFVIPGQGVVGAVEDQAKGVGSTLKGVTDFFGREESKWIRK